MNTDKKKLGIYVHIPFCVRKCAYCDFLSFEGLLDKHGPYIGALNREVDIINSKYGRKFDEDYEIASIYFGGGTPTSIKENYICDLLCKLKEKFILSDDVEITLEANPGTLSYESLLAYYNAGFNRLSMGLQSGDNAELACLSRIHTYEEFKDNYETAREIGFTNINVDIMTSLPFQNEHTLSKTLDGIFELNVKPNHISAYSLIVEPETPFYEKYGEIDENGYYTGPEGYALPSPEKERTLYYMVRDRLKAEGYNQYEISNYALPGYESEHNSAYWTRRDYIGLGLGASSFISEVRYKNSTDILDYIDNPEKILEKQPLDENARLEEFMFLGLRMMKGVSETEFEKVFNRRLSICYGPQIEELTREGLLTYDGDRYSLTPLGVDYGNYCFAKFLRS